MTEDNDYDLLQALEIKELCLGLVATGVRSYHENTPTDPAEIAVLLRALDLLDMDRNVARIVGIITGIAARAVIVSEAEQDFQDMIYQTAQQVIELRQEQA